MPLLPRVTVRRAALYAAIALLLPHPLLVARPDRARRAGAVPEAKWTLAQPF